MEGWWLVVGEECLCVGCWWWWCGCWDGWYWEGGGVRKTGRGVGEEEEENEEVVEED